jgi:uncharacterized membrane-anchored protein
MRSIIAILGLLIVLGAVNWSIFGKEQHLASGDIVYLELAPVDPRSLMQGDYMALRFGLAQTVIDALPKKEGSRSWRPTVDAPDGKVVVALDERRVASFVRIDDGTPLANGETRIKYRVRSGRVKFATNAFFFEEGSADIYQPALYGQFRVDADGELLLAAMYDKDLKQLAPAQGL